MGLGDLLLPSLNVMVSGVIHCKARCTFSSLHSVMSMHWEIAGKMPQMLRDSKKSMTGQEEARELG